MQHRPMPDTARIPSEKDQVPSDRDTAVGRARGRTDQTVSVPARPDHGENSASTIIEAPQKKRRHPLDPHDFPDGGGSGGAEAFRRSRVMRRRDG